MLQNLKFAIVKAYALGYLVKGFSFLKGYKTQIIAAIAVGVWGAEIFGYIQHEKAVELYNLLGGSGAITILQKLQRWQIQAEELAAEVKTQAKIAGENK